MKEIITKTVTMLFLFSVATGCIGVVAGCGSIIQRQSHLLTYQICVPAGCPLPPSTKLDLVTSDNSAGARVSNCTVTAKDESVVYQASTLIFPSKNRYLVIAPPDAAAQVFAIDHPRIPHPTEWVAWQPPLYTDTSRMPWWNAMNDQGKDQRNTDIPDDCAKIRFKVEAWHGMDAVPRISR
ncbi:MAG: hypothetical protein HQ523_06000 [Lentisphaerae bacterium]|nr:hypothetical protein [Lentisphaerota bacterium]